MAKGERKKLNVESRAEANRINQEHDRLGDTIYSRLPGAQGRGDQVFNAAFTGLQDFINGSGVGSGGGGGGASGTSANSVFSDLAGGGLSDENIGRIRGGGVFDEFSKTGGLSEGDRSNIRARGIAPISGMFEGLRDQFRHQSGISGAGPAYTASLARMNRDRSRAAADASLDTELGIMDRVNAGRMWGTEGMSGAELGLSSLLSQNKLAGAQGLLSAANSARAAGGADADRRLQALGMLTGMRDQVPAEELALLQLIGGNIGQRGGLAGNNLGMRYEANPAGTPWWQTLLGAGANVAGAFAGRPPRAGR